MSYFTHGQIEEIRQRLGLVPQEELEKSKGCFDWEKSSELSPLRSRHCLLRSSRLSKAHKSHSQLTLTYKEVNMKMRGIDWGHFMMGWLTALLLFLGPELVMQIIYGNTLFIILDSVVIVIDILCMLFWHQYCARKRAERRLEEIVEETIFDTLRKELSKNTKHRKEKEVI